ncbi:MAG: DUF4173 domain-containing protein [Patescibacteria group bacterium]|jgi:hypothetical protein
MQTDLEISNNVQSRDRFLDVTLIAVALTAIFHFLPADHPFGVAFAIFVVSLAVAMVLVAGLGNASRNKWSHLFLIPVVLSALADAIYSSHVVQFLSFVISLGSLALFAYWTTMPKIDFKRVKEFWPVAFFKNTVFPFGSLTNYISKIRGDRRLGGVAIGAIIAIPFLMVFVASFAAADQLFSKSFSSIFQNANFGSYVFKTIRDVIIGVYFLAAGTMMLTRAFGESKNLEEKSEQKPAFFNQTVFVTFLGLINVLFLIFVGFQFAYFFGGQDFLVAQGITYASYAREGFFQLLFVAGVVFAISWVIYWMTEMHQKWTKILNIALIVETGVIITSAIMRLSLYIDAYGLTLQRWWAMYCIILIGLTLLSVAVFAITKVTYSQSSKVAFLGILLVTSVALLVPTEKLIAKYNIDRFLSGEKKSFFDRSRHDEIVGIDSYYLAHLSSDAVYELVRFANMEWPAWSLFSGPARDREYFINQLIQKRNSLKLHISDVGLGASLSDHWALDALETLK